MTFKDLRNVWSGMVNVSVYAIDKAPLTIEDYPLIWCKSARGLTIARYALLNQTHIYNMTVTLAVLSS